MGYLKYKILSYNQCQNDLCFVQFWKTTLTLAPLVPLTMISPKWATILKAQFWAFPHPQAISQGLDFQKHFVTNFKFFRALIFINIKLGYSSALCILFLTNFKIYCILTII